MLLQNTRNQMNTILKNKHFDEFIMALIVINAIDLGLMTSAVIDELYGVSLFFIDKLCMAIFIFELIIKLFVYKKGFFKSGWNIFDFIIITISSLPFGSYFIILRTFRLLRAIKYMRRFNGLRRIINTFTSLLPNFFYTLAISAVFIYVFAIIAVILFGDFFVEFSSLGSATFALLQVVIIDSWATNIVRPVMSEFPHSWIFFASFASISFLIVASFFINAVADIVYKSKKPVTNYHYRKNNKEIK